MILTEISSPLTSMQAHAASAKKLFGGQKEPSDAKPESYGFYSKGCMNGAAAMPVDGPHWQVMRLSRNRRYAQPKLISIVQDLSEQVHKKGWNGLLVGDLSQPRGGPMLTGHASHQNGLDADIWFTPMPNKRMTYREREDVSAISILKKNSHYVDDRRWNKSYENLLKTAASYGEVQRILVHPGIKKKLCDTVKGDRSWLNKIRPYYGHHYHFHLRIKCQPGSTNCRRQKSTGTKTGCDKSLAWWFKSALGPAKKKPASKKKKKTAKKKIYRRKREKTLADLPNACATVLKQPGKSIDDATLMTRKERFSAPPIQRPAVSTAAIMRSKPIEAAKVKHPVSIKSIKGSNLKPAQQNAPQIAQSDLMPNSGVSRTTTNSIEPNQTVPIGDRIAEAHIPLSHIPIPEPRPGK